MLRVTSGLLVANVLLAAGATGATLRLTELPVAASPAAVQMRWSERDPGGSSRVEGRSSLPVRLDAATWRGRAGRVYLALPQQAPGALLVRWTTQGSLLSGQLQPGQRALVYAGLLPAQLADTLALQFLADGTRLNAARQLDFHFELDLE